MEGKAVFHRNPKMPKKTRTRITSQKKGKRKKNRKKRKAVTVLEHDHSYALSPIQEADSTVMNLSDCINPFNAVATFVESTKMQRFLKNA